MFGYDRRKSVVNGSGPTVRALKQAGRSVGSIAQLKAGKDDKRADDERLRGAFALAERAVQIGYWRYELASREHFWSPGMCALMGVSPDTTPDTDWLRQHVPVAEQVHIAQVIGEALRSCQPFFYRLHDVTLGPLLPENHAQIIDAQGEVELDEDGNPVALTGICQNVTGKMRDEEANEVAQEQYRAMMREASDIIIFYTVKGDILFASEALERILGRTQADIAHGGFLALVHPEDMDEARQISAVPGPGESLTATYRVLHSDGRYLWLEVVTRAIYDDTTGKVRNIVSVSRDISARKAHELEIEAAQERAEAANKAKSVFLANMSHELRTPLNAILGFSELMREQVFGPVGERYQEYVALIHSSGQHLLDLITDMLDMAKIEAGKMILAPERIPLSESVDDCLRILKEQAESGLVVLVNGVEGRPAVQADRRAIKQVLLNLLSNAIKFTPPGGTVTVSMTRSDSRAFVTVQDTGIGISPEDMARLGNPFEQAKANAMHAKGGTGLGLALVKALVEKHGGRFVMESQLGMGTAVTVDFPLERPRAAAIAG
jgi:PAS domain S-box-containing protein